MTAGWSAQSYSQRLKAGGMGDEAEAKYEEVSKVKWVRFGFNRPPFRMTHLSSFIRHAPDYVQADGVLVECMGLGRDGILKLKIEKLEALDQWADTQAVDLFVWNSAKQEHRQIQWENVMALAHEVEEFMGVREFNDGNKYLPLPWDRLVDVEA